MPALSRLNLLFNSVLVLVASLLLVGCSPEFREARYLKSGKSYLERKDYARALLEFRNAERTMPAGRRTVLTVLPRGAGLAGAGAEAWAFLLLHQSH